jgi:hypothetical protein
MQNAFHHGGWGMFPTAIFGLFMIAMAVRYATRPDRKQLRVVVGLSAVTLLAGLLGTIAGTMKSFMASEGASDLALVGFGESLNVVALAICLMTIAALFTTIGLARSAPSQIARTGAADLHAP